METKPNEPINSVVEENNITGYKVMKARFLGLTKRELFSAIAMNGILSNPSTPKEVITDEIGLLGIASFSCKAADALIEALNHTKK